VQFLFFILALVAAFLLGSFPTGVVIGRLVYHKDIRAGGSHNIGTTNAFRVLGKAGGVATFLGDAVKGLLAVLLMYWAVGFTPGFAQHLALVLACLAAICGHMFSPWLHFHGGKGIATAVGSIVLVLPWSVLICVIVFALSALLSHRVSMGSLAAALTLPIATGLIYRGSWPFLIFSIVVFGALWFAHRKNIVRIIHHEEPRFAIKK
jgi:glycerol-3-phosphate acyltransferase PlsY